MEHICHFTIQFREVVTNDFLKLRMFPNSLTISAFFWYINMQLNSINSCQGLEQKFHVQFYRIEIEMYMDNLSDLQLMERQSIDNFIIQFKNAKIRCHLDIPHKEFVNLAQNKLSYKLWKKFKVIEFTTCLSWFRKQREMKASWRRSIKGRTYLGFIL